MVRILHIYLSREMLIGQGGKMNRRKLPYNGRLENSARGMYNWHRNCCLQPWNYPKVDLASSVEEKSLKGQSFLGSFFTLPSPLNHGVR